MFLVNTRAAVRTLPTTLAAWNAMKLVIVVCLEPFHLFVILFFDNAAVESFQVCVDVWVIKSWFAGATITTSFESVIGDRFALKHNKENCTASFLHR